MDNLPGRRVANKFGRNISCPAAGGDLWDNIGLWKPPTGARTHSVASTDAGDALAGLGAQVVRIYGLTSWATREVFEDIDMAGLVPALTANAYVMINRMEVIQWGTSGPNIGNIIATAGAPDSYPTMVIRAATGTIPPYGQSSAAFIGWPSIQDLCLTKWYVGITRTGGVGDADLYLLYNSIPDLVPVATGVPGGGYRTLRYDGVTTAVGDGHVSLDIDPAERLPGPGILKIECIPSIAGLDVNGGWAAYLMDNASAP